MHTIANLSFNNFIIWKRMFKKYLASSDGSKHLKTTFFNIQPPVPRRVGLNHHKNDRERLTATWSESVAINLLHLNK